MTQDNSFPYVLLCSSLGTMFSLAAVWISTTYMSALAIIGA
jgi:hypothetical protein